MTNRNPTPSDSVQPEIPAEEAPVIAKAEEAAADPIIEINCSMHDFDYLNPPVHLPLA